jgi:hypothetical protein
MLWDDAVSWKLSGITGKTFIPTAGNPTEIRTVYFLITILQRYRYIILFGGKQEKTCTFRNMLLGLVNKVSSCSRTCNGVGKVYLC